jgi:hypothetical protein
MGAKLPYFPWEHASCARVAVSPFFVAAMQTAASWWKREGRGLLEVTHSSTA